MPQRRLKTLRSIPALLSLLLYICTVQVWNKDNVFSSFLVQRVSVTLGCRGELQLVVSSPLSWRGEPALTTQQHTSDAVPESAVILTLYQRSQQAAKLVRHRGELRRVQWWQKETNHVWVKEITGDWAPQTEQPIFADTSTLNPLISVTLSCLQHEDHFHVL